MAAATDRLLPLPGRRTTISLSLLLGAALTGCQHMESARRHDAHPRLAALNPGRLVRKATTTSRPPDACVAPAPLAAIGPPADLPAGTAPAISIPVVGPMPTVAPIEITRPVGPRPAPTPTVEGLVADARRAVDGLSAYQVRLHRQERVGSALQPAEVVVLSIRRQPKAVRIEWPDGPNREREVLYDAATAPGLIHIRRPNPVVPRISLPLDNPLVMRNSRHPITEAGLDSIVEFLEAWARGTGPQPVVMQYAGREQVEGLERPGDKLTVRAVDGQFCQVYLDAESHLPALVQLDGPGGELLERYHFHDLRADRPDLAAAEAFDPDRRWGAAKGLFSRLAEVNPDGPTPPAATR